MVILVPIYLYQTNTDTMKDLLINIEAAINSTVIESGEFEPGMNYYDDYILESGDNVYIADFYINTKIGIDNEPNTYEIEVIFIAQNLESGDKILYNKNDIFETLDILNPNN